MNSHHHVPAYAFSLFAGEGIGYSSSFNQLDSLLPRRSYGQAKLNYAVNITTGNLIAHDRNISVTDTGNRIDFSYIYNSQATDPVTAWKLDVGRKINVDSITRVFFTSFFSNTLNVTEADGHLSTFTCDSDGNYYGPAIQGSRPCIKINKDSNTYSWFHPKTGTTELFDSSGNLTKRIDHVGNETNFEYAENKLLKAVVAPSGARYEIRRSGSELAIVLVSTTQEESLIHTYTFNGGNLINSTTPDGYAIQYLYDEAGKVKSVTQSDGSALQFGFYAQSDANKNKIKSIQIGSDEKQINMNSFTYVNSTTTLLDGSNVETTFNGDTKNAITIMQNNDSKSQDMTQRVYSPYGQVSKIIYPDHSAEQFEYQDKTGLIINYTHRHGASTRYLYDDKNNSNLVTAKVEYAAPDEKKQVKFLSKTQYVYDTSVKGKNALLRYEVSAEGFVKEFSYTLTGQVETVREFPKDKFIFSSDDKPLTLNQLDSWKNEAKRLSRSILAKNDYDKKGKLIKTVRFSDLDEKTYNGIENAFSTEEKFEYDLLGHTTKHQKKTAGLDAKAQYKKNEYKYNDNGNLTLEQVGVDTKLMQTTQYEYKGNKIAVTHPNQRIEIKQFNSQSLLEKMTTSVSDEKTVRTGTVERDLGGRVVDIVGSDKLKTLHYYDAQNRIKYTVTPKGAVTEYEYNREFNYQSQTQYDDCIDPSKNPGEANTVVSAPGKDRTSYTFYHLDGQIKYQIDPENTITEYRYNDLGKLVSHICYSRKLIDDDLIALQHGKSVDFKPDRSMDRITRYFYDKEGNKIGEQDPSGYVTQFKRDAAGRLIEEIHFARQLQVTADNFLAICSACSAENNEKDSHHYYYYNLLDQCVMEVNAEGAMTEHVFWADGNQKSSTQYYNGVSADWQDKGVPPKPIPSAKDQVTQYEYDELSRLHKQISSSGAVTRYTYDEMNHRTGAIVEEMSDIKLTADKISDHYRASEKKFDGWGQVIASADPLVMERIAKISLKNISDQEKKTEQKKVWHENADRYQYSEVGLKVKSTDPLGRDTVYYYDEDKNPVVSIDATGIVTENKYNTFGEVIDVCIYYNRVAIDKLAILKGGTMDDAIRKLIIVDDKKDAHTIQIRDRRGLVTSMIRPSGVVTQYTYNAHKECETETKHNDNKALTLVITHEHDGNGNETKSTKQSGDLKTVVQSEYNFQNKLTQYTNERGARTLFETDRLGRIREIKKEETKDSFFIDQQVKFDAFSRPVEVTNADNQKTVIEHSQNGRYEEQKSAAQESKSSITKNIFDEVVENRNGESNVQVTKHAADGQVTFQQLGDAIISTQYNLKGLIDSITTATNATTKFVYNGSDQVEMKTVSDTKGLKLSTNYTVNAHGKNEKITDARSIETKNEFDRGGHLAKTTRDPSGRALTATYSYHAQNLLETTTLGDIKNPDQTKHKNTYDGFSRIIAETTDPDGLSITKQFEYDSAGNVIKEIDPNNNVTRKYYDLLNRKRFEVKSLDDKQVYATEWAYTRTGKVKSVRTYQPMDAKLIDDKNTFESLQKSLQPDDKNDSVTLHYYDAANRPILDIVLAYDALTSQLQAIVEEKRYDKADRQIKKIKYGKPLDAAQYSEWTADSLLKKIAIDLKDDNKAKSIQSYYDAQSRECFIINQDGKVNEKRYDSAGRVIAEIHYAKPLANVSDKKTDDISAQLQKQIDPARDRCTYRVYDSLSHEIFTVSPDNSVMRKDYDESGNIVRVCQFKELIKPQETYAALVNTLNQLKLDDKMDAITESKFDIDNLVETATDPLKNTDHYYRDSLGNILEHTDRAKKTWSFKYDRAGRQVEETTPKINVTTVVKNEKGQLEFTDKTTRVTQKTDYDKSSNKIRLTKGVIEGKTEEEKSVQARSIDFKYTPQHILSATKVDNVQIDDSTKKASLNDLPTQKATLVTSSVTNALGRVLVEKNEAGVCQLHVYDNVGRVVLDMNGEQAVTHYFYSNSDKPTKVVKYAAKSKADLTLFQTTGLTAEKAFQVLGLDLKDPDNRVTEFSYTSSGEKISIKTGAIYYYADGEFGIAQPETKIQANLLRDCIAESRLVKPGVYANRFTWFDRCGRKIAELDENKYLTRYEMNSFGKVQAQTEYAKPISAEITLETTVDQLDSAIVKSDKDRIKTYRYNLLGKKTDETDQNAEFESLVLDEKNSPQLVTLKGDLTRSWEYNSLEQEIKMTHEDGASEQTFYDAVGNEVAKTKTPRTSVDEKGNPITITPLEVKKPNAHGQIAVTQKSTRGGTLSKDSDSLPTLVIQNESDLHQGIKQYDNRGLVQYKQDAENRVKGFTFTPARKVAREISTLTNYYPVAIKAEKKSYPSKYAATAAPSFTPVVHLDEKRYLFDKNNQPIQLSVLRDNKVEQTTFCQYNAFDEFIGEGSDGKIWSISKKTDSQGNAWLTDSEKGATISLTDLRGAETLKLQSGTTELRKAAYTNLKEIVAQGPQTIDRTEIKRDLAGNAISYLSPLWFRDQNKLPTHSSAYDHWKNVVSETDSFGNRTDYEFNHRNKVKKQVQPDVDAIIFKNDKLVLDEKGQFLRIRPMTLHGYNKRGIQVGTADANNHTHGMVLDESGQWISSVLGDGTKEKSRTVNAVGQTTSLTDAHGKTWKFAYDRVSNLVAEQSPVGSDDCKYEYDEQNQRRTDWDAGVYPTRYNHDPLGNISERYLPLGQCVTTKWDRNHQPLFIRDPDGSSQIWVRDYFGTPLRYTDMSGHVYRYNYNFKNQILEKAMESGERWESIESQQNVSYLPEDEKHAYPVMSFLRRPCQSVPQSILHTYSYGVLDSMTDMGLRRKTQYQSDTEGRRIGIEIRHASDNVLLYNVSTQWDELGRESKTTDIRLTHTGLYGEMSSLPKYDPVGNRLNITTSVIPASRSKECSAPASINSTWNKIDVVNRVTISDGELSNDGRVVITQRKGTAYTYENNYRKYETQIAGNGSEIKAELKYNPNGLLQSSDCGNIHAEVQFEPRGYARYYQEKLSSEVKVEHKAFFDENNRQNRLEDLANKLVTVVREFLPTGEPRIEVLTDSNNTIVETKVNDYRRTDAITLSKVSATCGSSIETASFYYDANNRTHGKAGSMDEPSERGYPSSVYLDTTTDGWVMNKSLVPGTRNDSIQTNYLRNVNGDMLAGYTSFNNTNLLSIVIHRSPLDNINSNANYKQWMQKIIDSLPVDTGIIVTACEHTNQTGYVGFFENKRLVTTDWNTKIFDYTIVDKFGTFNDGRGTTVADRNRNRKLYDDMLDNAYKRKGISLTYQLQKNHYYHHHPKPFSMIIYRGTLDDISRNDTFKSHLEKVIKELSVTDGFFATAGYHTNESGYVGFFLEGRLISDKWNSKLFTNDSIEPFGKFDDRYTPRETKADRNRDSKLYDTLIDVACSFAGIKKNQEILPSIDGVVIDNKVHPVGISSLTKQDAANNPCGWDEPVLLQQLGPQHYVVKTGDTFASISKLFGGDTNSAEYIARANGFGVTKYAPKPGHLLRIPQIIPARNQANTVRPDQDFLRVIAGSLSPKLTTPMPSIPEEPHHHHNVWGDVIKVIAIAAVCVAAPHLAGALIASHGALFLAASGVMGALGDAAVQGLAIECHVQKNFSMTEMFETGVSCALAHTLSASHAPTALAENALKIGTANIAMQLTEMKTGLRSKFSFADTLLQVTSSVAASKINQGIDHYVDNQSTVSAITKNAADTVSSTFLGNKITHAPVNVENIAMNAIGSQIGNEAGSRFVNSDAMQMMLAPKQKAFNTDINPSDRRWSSGLSDMASRQRQVVQVSKYRNSIFADSPAAISFDTQESKRHSHSFVPQPQSTSARVLAELSSQSGHAKGFWRKQLDVINTVHAIEKQMAIEYYSELKQDLNEVVHGEFKASSVKQLAMAGLLTASVVAPNLLAAGGARIAGFASGSLRGVVEFFGREKIENVANIGVHNAADALRLKTTLNLQEAGLLDESGCLTQTAIRNAESAIRPGTILNNRSVVEALTRDGSRITDWNKLTTQSIELSSGQRVQVHFYRNRMTGEVNYTHPDFKIKGVVNQFYIPKPLTEHSRYIPLTAQDILSNYRP